MEKVDRRTARTRKALRSALITLLQQRDYDDFNVNELLELADVGRSTFYSHYTSKDDLLRNGLKAMGDEIRAQLTTEESGEPGQFLAFSRPLLQHVDEHRALYRHLRGRGGEVFSQMFGQLVGDLVREGMKRVTGSPPTEPEVQYVRGAFLGLATWWLEHSTSYSAKDIDELFQRMSGWLRPAR